MVYNEHKNAVATISLKCIQALVKDSHLKTRAGKMVAAHWYDILPAYDEMRNSLLNL